MKKLLFLAVFALSFSTSLISCTENTAKENEDLYIESTGKDDVPSTGDKDDEETPDNN